MGGGTNKKITPLKIEHFQRVPGGIKFDEIRISCGHHKGGWLQWDHLEGTERVLAKAQEVCPEPE